jgi:hypothetical protein
MHFGKPQNDKIGLPGIRRRPLPPEGSGAEALAEACLCIPMATPF